MSWIFRFLLISPLLRRFLRRLDVLFSGEALRSLSPDRRRTLPDLARRARPVFPLIDHGKHALPSVHACQRQRRIRKTLLKCRRIFTGCPRTEIRGKRHHEVRAVRAVRFWQRRHLPANAERFVINLYRRERLCQKDIHGAPAAQKRPPEQGGFGQPHNPDGGHCRCLRPVSGWYLPIPGCR